MVPRRRRWLVVSLVVGWVAAAAAQQLLDRVVARVGTTAITLSDVRAAMGLGLVDTAAAGDAAIRPLIDRELMLLEVARFPPPEPSPADIDARVATMTAYAGAGLERLMQTTGVSEQRIRDLARDALRIQAYIDQRFGGAVQITADDARRYYDAHPEEFTENGSPIPFEAAEADARRRASDERLRATVTQWLEDLRARADIVIVEPSNDPNDQNGSNDPNDPNDPND